MQFSLKLIGTRRAHGTVIVFTPLPLLKKIKMGSLYAENTLSNLSCFMGASDLTFNVSVLLRFIQ